MAINRFQQGSGCYTCRRCKKLTRDVGESNYAGGSPASAGLCLPCYDKEADEIAVLDEQMTQEEFDRKWGPKN